MKLLLLIVLNWSDIHALYEFMSCNLASFGFQNFACKTCKHVLLGQKNGLYGISVPSANNKDAKNKRLNHHVLIVAIKSSTKTNPFFTVTFIPRAARHTNTIVATVAIIRPKSHIAFTLILAIQIFAPVPEVMRTAFNNNHFAILVFLQLQREALLTGIACNSWYLGTSPIAVETFNALIGGGRRGRGCRDGKSEVFNQSRVTAWRVSGWRSAKCPGVSV